MPTATLRIVSFNVFYALGKKRLERTVFDAFARLDPDAICLQEVLIGKKRNFAQDLADSMNYHLSFSLRATFGSRSIGMAILTKKLPLKNDSIILPHSSHRRPRILQTVTFKTRDIRWRIANTQLNVASPKTRQAQLETILGILSAKRNKLPTILAADFNTKTGKEITIFTSTLREAGFASRKTPTYSWKLFGIKTKPGREKFLGIRVKGKFDWIAVRNCTISAAGMLNQVQGSDHKPVWADITYPMIK